MQTYYAWDNYNHYITVFRLPKSEVKNHKWLDYTVATTLNELVAIVK